MLSPEFPTQFLPAPFLCPVVPPQPYPTAYPLQLERSRTLKKMWSFSDACKILNLRGTNLVCFCCPLKCKGRKHWGKQADGGNQGFHLACPKVKGMSLAYMEQRLKRAWRWPWSGFLSCGTALQQRGTCRCSGHCFTAMGVQLIAAALILFQSHRDQLSLSINISHPWAHPKCFRDPEKKADGWGLGWSSQAGDWCHPGDICVRSPSAEEAWSLGEQGQLRIALLWWASCCWTPCSNAWEQIQPQPGCQVGLESKSRKEEKGTVATRPSQCRKWKVVQHAWKGVTNFHPQENKSLKPKTFSPSNIEQSSVRVCVLLPWLVLNLSSKILGDSIKESLPLPGTTCHLLKPLTSLMLKSYLFSNLRRVPAR